MMVVKSHVVVSLFLVAVPLAAAQPPVAPSTPSETVALDAIARGAKGYGISVFEGDATERFEVEAIGVLRNSSPQIDYLLVRLSGRDLERSGVIAGMSGSPVYFDGKLAGAVAFAWPFSHDAIGGVTPIADMRAIPSSGGAAPAGGIAVAAEPSWRHPERLLDRGDPLERLAAALGPLAPSTLDAGARTGVVWTASGFGPTTRGMLEQQLGALAPMGGAAGGAGAGDGTPSGELHPGDAVAAILVDGDFALAATGTVTDVIGDRVFAFGHPFLSLGPTSIPMARAEILTVLSSAYSSFKISNAGGVVGALESDYRAGISGRVGAEAPMLPVAITLKSGQEERNLALRVARIPQLTPILAAISVMGAQEAIAGTFGVAGIDLVARFDLVNHPDLVLRQSFDGVNAVQQSTVALLSWLAFLVDNGFAEVDLAGVEVELESNSGARTESIVGGWASRSRAKPGEEVTLFLETAPWRGGGTQRRSITVRVPEEAPAGMLSYLVGDGPTIDAARIAFEKPSPQRFEQALRIVSGFHSRRDLVAIAVVRAPGLSVDGEVLANLPGSVQSVWNAAPPQSASRLGLAVLDELVYPSESPLEGAIRLDIEVVRRDALDQSELAEVEAGREGAAEPAPTSDNTKGGGES